MKKIKGVFFDLEGALLVPGQAERRVVPGGLRVIRRLYERGYRLGVVSRLGGEEITNWLREEGIVQYFDAVSAFSGPALRTGCEELGLEPEECVCVTGGADGLPVNRVSREAAAAESQPDYTVRRLGELLDLPVLQ